VNPGQQNFEFPSKFPRNFDFSGNFTKNIDFDFAGKFLKNVNFSGKFFKNFDFSGNLKQFRFSRQKLLIYSYFWTIFSISLQKSPLSNILISRPVHDPSCEHPTTLPAQNLGNATTNPPGLTPLDMVDRCGAFSDLSPVQLLAIRDR